ncbi:MAG: hypothetical protein FWD47_06895 [Treponema sp.]|nr:hypothetical protein [Treponema sp.]
MKKIYFYLPVILVSILIFSCKTTKPAVTETPEVTSTVTITAPAEDRNTSRIDTFDPRTVSEAQYASTRIEVQQFIENLNQIIRNRNFQAWRACLSPEYLAEISSAENLRQISEQPAMRTRNIVLRNVEDYFIHVVVPSRANSRVDDIEFITANRVNAFTINVNSRGEEQRLRLYALERVNNTWTIIN